MRARVKIHRYISGDLAIFYGPRKLAEYDSKGILKMPLKQQEYVAA